MNITKTNNRPTGTLDRINSSFFNQSEETLAKNQQIIRQQIQDAINESDNYKPTNQLFDDDKPEELFAMKFPTGK